MLAALEDDGYLDAARMGAQIHRDFAALEGLRRDPSKKQELENALLRLRRNLDFELKGGGSLGDLERSWLGLSWDRYGSALAYLQGVYSSYRWDASIRDRRLHFEAALTLLADPGVDLDIKRKILSWN